MMCLLTTFTQRGIVRERGHMIWTDANEACRYGKLFYGEKAGVDLEQCEHEDTCAAAQAIKRRLVLEDPLPPPGGHSYCHETPDPMTGGTELRRIVNGEHEI